MEEKKSPRRLGLGRTWADESTVNKKVTRPVLVRTVDLVMVGQMVGEYGRPHAFVWTESRVPPALVWVIHPGISGPWLREEGYAIDWRKRFADRRDIQSLFRGLDAWSREIEKHWKEDRDQRFFWGAFHAEGVALTRRLQLLVAENIAIRYLRPAEDPLSQVDREIFL